MTDVPYGIGATATVSSLESLGLPTPQSEAPDYAAYVTNGAGEEVGQGWLTATWRFSDLSAAQVAVLEAYEGDCYVRTLTADDEYDLYSARLVLPPRRAPKNGRWLDYVAEFRAMEVVT